MKPIFNGLGSHSVSGWLTAARDSRPVKPTPSSPVERPTDTVALDFGAAAAREKTRLGTEPLDHEATTGPEPDDFARLDSLLKELQGLVAGAERSEGLSTDRIAQLQGEIDRVTESVDQAARAAGPGGLGNFSVRDPRLIYEAVSPQVERFAARAALQPGESLDVIVDVTAPAERAGWLLSFGKDRLDLSAATALFVIDLGGIDGSRELSFASGTMLTDIAAAINTITDETGVVARQSGTALRLESTDYGADAFVSVRMIEDGSINTAVAYAGAYRLTEDFPATSLGNYTPFSALLNKDTDFGADVQGSINGIAAEGRGTTLSAGGHGFHASLRLGTGPVGPGEANATYTGSFLAMTMSRPPARSIEQTAPSEDASRLAKGLREAIASLRSADTLAGATAGDIARARALLLASNR